MVYFQDSSKEMVAQELRRKAFLGAFCLPSDTFTFFELLITPQHEWFV